MSFLTVTLTCTHTHTLIHALSLRQTTLDLQISAMTMGHCRLRWDRGKEARPRSNCCKIGTMNEASSPTHKHTYPSLTHTSPTHTHISFKCGHRTKHTRPQVVANHLNFSICLPDHFGFFPFHLSPLSGQRKSNSFVANLSNHRNLCVLF